MTGIRGRRWWAPRLNWQRKKVKMDFKRELQKQLNFILTSCRAYDQGIREEAIRIAVAARVLFHQTPNSHALIRHHTGFNALKLRSTCADLSVPNAHFLGFIGMEPSTEQFHPYLDNVQRDAQVSIDAWWSQEPILKLMQNQETITRKQLILAAANKDGGAHVETSKPGEYERLESGLGFQVDVTFTSGLRKMVTLRFANLAALRQIGHELLTSPDLLALAN